ncbi:hypothetical protein EDD22DRAFT_951490 [Suillus occidentalis]|nr:hypothetical protein EDD22DRAFT_951490 [Suillus occidentalis]
MPRSIDAQLELDTCLFASSSFQQECSLRVIAAFLVRLLYSQLPERRSAHSKGRTPSLSAICAALTGVLLFTFATLLLTSSGFTERTVHGKWYPVFIDAIIQSNEAGFVSTRGSTMSMMQRLGSSDGGRRELMTTEVIGVLE